MVPGPLSIEPLQKISFMVAAGICGGGGGGGAKAKLWEPCQCAEDGRQRRWEKEREGLGTRGTVCVGMR